MSDSLRTQKILLTGKFMKLFAEFGMRDFDQSLGPLPNGLTGGDTPPHTPSQHNAHLLETLTTPEPG